MTSVTPPAVPRRLTPGSAAWTAVLLVPINFAVWLLAVAAGPRGMFPLLALFVALAFAQLVLGIVAVVGGIRSRLATGRGGIGAAITGVLTAAGALVGGLGGAVLGAYAAGGAWGRPLRVRGRQVHPELRVGSDWTLGERPDPAGLDQPTRRALEALWLHDAQKEHASVPAFARISWLLAAAGAPAELIAWSHRAALEEIEHTRLCFALAAGYAGRSHTVAPMPELLLGGLGVQGNVLELLASESLGDGCQLEDFNADVAAACADACEEPVTRVVLERIAREERSHAGFSWAVLGWLLVRDRGTVQPALARALEVLARYPRPTAVSWDKRQLVARADANALRRHGRLPDQRWGELWQARLECTTRRMRELLGAAREERVQQEA